MFIQNGIDPTRLAAEGFADTRPKVSNRDVSGKPLAVNQAINRRVSVHIFPR
jgi:chemotaxis protein MotB